MFRLLKVLLLVTLMQLALPASAESLKPKVSNVDASVSKSGAILETTDLNEMKYQVKLLETQLQMTREYQNSLLDTVYWALGGVFIVVSLLLGFGWLVNFKVYERDKDALKAELENITRGKVIELDEVITTKIASINSNIDKQIKESINEILKPHIKSTSAIESRVFQMELKRLKEDMEANKSNHMALTDALGLLELCNRKQQREVPDIVQFMLKKIDLGGKLTAMEITRVNVVLDSLPAHYRTLTEKLRTKLVASDIF